MQAAQCICRPSEKKNLKTTKFIDIKHGTQMMFGLHYYSMQPPSTKIRASVRDRIHWPARKTWPVLMLDITQGMAVFRERVVLCEKYECLFLQCLMCNSQNYLDLKSQVITCLAILLFSSKKVNIKYYYILFFLRQNMSYHRLNMNYGELCCSNLGLSIVRFESSENTCINNNKFYFIMIPNNTVNIVVIKMLNWNIKDVVDRGSPQYLVFCSIK